MKYNRLNTIECLNEQLEFLQIAIEELEESDNIRAESSLECIIDVLVMERELIKNKWKGAPIAEKRYTKKLRKLGKI